MTECVLRSDPNDSATIYCLKQFGRKTISKQERWTAPTRFPFSPSSSTIKTSLDNIIRWDLTKNWQTQLDNDRDGLLFQSPSMTVVTARRLRSQWGGTVSGRHYNIPDLIVFSVSDAIAGDECSSTYHKRTSKERLPIGWFWRSVPSIEESYRFGKENKRLKAKQRNKHD